MDRTPNVHVGTAYAITPTIEEVIRECDEAWVFARKLRDESRDKADLEGTQDAIYMSLVREHTELNKTYPVILAAMAAGSYHQDAVRKFFKYVKDHPWRTQDEFFEIQSAYNLILYRKTHPRASQKVAAKVREQTHDALIENERAMKEQVDRAQREAEETNQRHAKARIADMISRIPHDAAILLQSEVRPLVVIFDDTQY